jgi:hypothetical protein
MSIHWQGRPDSYQSEKPRLMPWLAQSNFGSSLGQAQLTVSSMQNACLWPVAATQSSPASSS